MMPHLTTSGLWSSPEIKNLKNLQMFSLASRDFSISLIYVEFYFNGVSIHVLGAFNIGTDYFLWLNVGYLRHFLTSLLPSAMNPSVLPVIS